MLMRFYQEHYDKVYCIKEHEKSSFRAGRGQSYKQKKQNAYLKTEIQRNHALKANYSQAYLVTTSDESEFEGNGRTEDKKCQMN